MARDPAPAPAPSWPFVVALEDVAPGTGANGSAFDSLSLRVDRGERGALVRPRGAGKTAVANLLVRFLDPEAS